MDSLYIQARSEPEYRENPLRLFSLDFLRSGGVFYGGLIAAIIAGYFLIRRYKLPWWKTGDAFVPGIALGNAIGRQGCFAAGCCWGKPTTLPWGVHFTEAGHAVTGVPIVDVSGAPLHLHPTQLYESFGALLIFFFLLWLHRRKVRDTLGQLKCLRRKHYLHGPEESPEPRNRQTHCNLHSRHD